MEGTSKSPRRGPDLFYDAWATHNVKAPKELNIYLPKDFDIIQTNYLQKITDITTTDDIPDDLIINWDQTATNLLPWGNWTMEKRGKEQVPIHGMDDKRHFYS